MGTGRLLGISDFGSSRVQSFYVVADGATLANARSGLVQQTYTRAGDSVTTNPVDWTTGRGWFMDLPAGEQANTRPAIAQGTVAFTTNTAGLNDCSASSYLYVLNVLNGHKITSLGFASSSLSTTDNSSGARALLSASGTAVAAGRTANGTSWKRDLSTGVVIPPSKNAWREIRR